MKKIYRWIVDHLTKGIGVVGLAFVQLISTDPEPIRQASQYLPAKWGLTVAKILFGLVILRGWYTGWKAKQKEQALANAQAALPPVQFIPVVQPVPTNTTSTVQP